MNPNKLCPLLKRLTCFFILIALLAPAILEAGRVYVRGYYRKNGTYVQPHYRTSPDDILWNNYSFPKTRNPNPDKITLGDIDKYLNTSYSKLPTLEEILSSNLGYVDMDGRIILSSPISDKTIVVIDGDTFYYGGEKIRIYGFDAPEFGEEGFYLAKWRLAEVLHGGIITIKRVAKDKYGRTIAKVKVNGVDIVDLLK